MRSVLLVAAVGFAAAPLAAQLTHTIPLGTATAPGNSSNAFPWGTAATGWGGLRLMAVYDSSNFTGANINFPIIITRLKWRVNDSTQTWSGGTFSTSTVALSTAAVDWSQVTTNFASNHGANLTTCYSGPVTIAGGSSNGVGVIPPTVVDITLTTPFLYDPSAGDLVIDVDYPSSSWSGGTVPGQMDVQGTGAQASRVYASSNYPAANGTTTNHGPVVEFEYLPGTGYAYFESYGLGCGGGGPPGIYELFDGVARTNDLANTGIQLQPLPGSYVAIQGASQLVAPAGTPLALGSSQTLQVALPWSFPHATGSTSSLWICSNGWIGLAATTATDPNESVGGLRSGVPRVCALWDDLNPTATGASVHAGVDPTNPALFHVTWTNVPETGGTGGNTMQVTFGQSGSIELKWGALAALDGLVGYHPGGGAEDPGITDVSAMSALVLGDGRPRLTIGAAPGSRPRLGQQFSTAIRGIPPGAPLGALVLGVTQMNPGVSLAPLGMTGCSQYASVDATFVYLPSGTTFTLPLSIPNATAFAGTALYSQSAVWATGFNPLGLIASNGGIWHLEVQ